DVVVPLVDGPHDGAADPPEPVDPDAQRHPVSPFVGPPPVPPWSAPDRRREQGRTTLLAGAGTFATSAGRTPARMLGPCDAPPRAAVGERMGPGARKAPARRRAGRPSASPAPGPAGWCPTSLCPPSATTRRPGPRSRGPTPAPGSTGCPAAGA